ncbi:hypothetical protein ABK905_04300 [Acerihabitans sp. KWT182]|uniref:Uncharacterized protein n=1 Tax=Acerihabitans sp. KWT182 TaxID=3157919 RepID=A0AAU7QE39_9GAMM
MYKAKKKIYECIIDARPGTKHEFRGESANKLINTLTFSCMADFCAQLNTHPDYNFKSKQVAPFLVGELNKLDEAQAKDYLQDCHIYVKRLITFNEEDKKYQLVQTGQQLSATSPRQTGDSNEPPVAAGTLGIVQKVKPPVAARTLGNVPGTQSSLVSKKVEQVSINPPVVSESTAKTYNVARTPEQPFKTGKVQKLIKKFEMKI